jgi:hypothetical protein
MFVFYGFTLHAIYIQILENSKYLRDAVSSEMVLVTWTAKDVTLFKP